MSFVQDVRKAIVAVDPALAIDGIDPLPRLMEQSIAEERLVAQLATAFGTLALLLAGVGLYGVMTYAITRRTGEIGLRVALFLEERLEAVRQDHGSRGTLARRATRERLRISGTEWRRKIDRNPHSSRTAAADARNGLVIRPSTSQGPRRYPQACWIND